MAAPKYMTEDEMVKLNASSGGGGGCPFQRGPPGGVCSAGSPAGLKLIGPKELAAHNTKEDCWLLIRGKVYNLTEFLSIHPGGQSILLHHAGTDATNAFNDVPHSSRAHGMMSKYVCAEMLPHGYDQTGLDTEDVSTKKAQTLTAEERKLMKRKQAEQDARLDDTSLPFHFMNKYFTWFDPIVPSILLPLLCIYMFVCYVPEYVAVVEASETSPYASSLIVYTALTVCQRLLTYSSVIVLLLANPYMQHVFIPSYLYFWIPQSWIGAPSNIFRSVLNYVMFVFTSPSVHVAAWANVFYWTSISVLLMSVYRGVVNSGVTLVRTAVICASLCEFLNEYVAMALTDAHRPSYFHYFRPLIVFKNLMDGFESLKFYGIICLYLYVLLDTYDCLIAPSSADVFTNIAGFSTDNVVEVNIWGTKLGTFTELSGKGLVSLSLVIFAVSRVLYSKCLHSLGEQLCRQAPTGVHVPSNGVAGSCDSFGAVALTLPMSCVYSLLCVYALKHHTTIPTTVFSAYLATAESHELPLLAAGQGQSAGSGVDGWLLTRTTLMVLLFTLTHTSYAVLLAIVHKSSFCVHTTCLLIALAVWLLRVSPSLGGGWWSFFWFVAGIHCELSFWLM
jgi:hypothetical protein